MKVEKKIQNGGWDKYSTWDHSLAVTDLYTKRCRRDAEEMTCHAQAAEILQSHVNHGDSLLDVGCGSGYFFHSLVSRNISAEYWGVDASRKLVEIGKNELANFGLPTQNLQNIRIEDLDGSFDHIICINVLTYIDNYHRPLERMLKMAKKTLLLRESIKEKTEYSYVKDNYLDGSVGLNVHINHYGRDELIGFMKSYGFEVEVITDLRTGGESEMVIDYPHYWTFLLAKRVINV